MGLKHFLVTASEVGRLWNKAYTELASELRKTQRRLDEALVELDRKDAAISRSCSSLHRLGTQVIATAQKITHAT